MKLKIVHILPDDKFLDSAINSFELLKGISNEFLCLTTKEIRLIKQKDKLQIFSSGRKMVDYINSNGFNVLVLHSTCIPFKYLNAVNRQVVFVWLSWGYDLFEASLFPFVFKNPINLLIYKPLTAQLLKGWSKLFYSFFTEIRRMLCGFTSCRLSFYKRVVYVSTVTDLEFKLLKENPIFSRIQRFRFRYIDRILVPDSQLSMGNDILIGNSAAFANNHLDVLNELSRLDLDRTRHIVVPFSYGGDRGYKCKIKESLSKFSFRNQVALLEHFIEREEYAKIINNCRYAIMGHIRQQAMGNIDILFLQGSKIFFYEDSISYRQLKSEGFHVYSIEEMDDSSLNTPLSDEEIKDNIRLIRVKANYDKFIHDLQEDMNAIGKSFKE